MTRSRRVGDAAIASAVALMLCLLATGCGSEGDKAPQTGAGGLMPTTRPAPPSTRSATGQAGLVPLPLTLPKPVFRGTPKNIPPGTTVAKPTGKRREVPDVPPGVSNVARGKPVTSSDPEPIIGELKLVTDGDKEAREGTHIELGPKVQWVQIDLEAPQRIYAILVWHYHGQAVVYRDVVVQVADDADFISNVRTLFNNDQDNSAGLRIGRDREYFETYEGKLIDARTDGKPIVARYVRLYSNGSTDSDMNRYTEVEVYGSPAR
jgi:hypothetical protein